MLLILVYIGRAHELFPGTGTLSVAKIVIALTVLFYLGKPKLGGGHLMSYAPVKYVLCILVMIVLSIPFSAYSGGSLAFLENTYSKTLVFFFIAAAVMDSAPDLTKINMAVVGSVLLLSVAILLVDMKGRASASHTYDPNDVAFVMVTLLPLVYFRMTSLTGHMKLVLAGIIIAILLACLKTVSRGGLLGLCVVGGAIYMKKVKEGEGLRQVVVLVIVAAIIIANFAPQGYWDRMSTMLNPDADYNMNQSTGRIDIWKRGLTMMATHIFGVGAGAFEVAEGRMHEGRGKWSSAHNSFIQIGAELGVVGLYMYVMLLVSSLRCIRDCRERDVDGVVVPHWLLDGLEVSFYGYMATGFFLSQAYSSVLYLLVAMAVSARKAVDREVQQAASPAIRVGRVL